MYNERHRAIGPFAVMRVGSARCNIRMGQKEDDLCVIGCYEISKFAFRRGTVLETGKVGTWMVRQLII
jgi:hypothetical protein